MARITTTTLTANNRIYLYQLLSRELGCGKQTFLPTVEEALASDRMTADDLGFESTRALLEALDEFIKLTVFKGGRIYATVIAQPAWDDALTAFEAAGSKGSAGGGPTNKPWKRKKTDKALKPVRPKRVKRPEPEPEPEAAPSEQPPRTKDAESVAEAAATPEAGSPAETAAAMDAGAPVAPAPATDATQAVKVTPTGEAKDEGAADATPACGAPEPDEAPFGEAVAGAETAPETTPSVVSTPEPAISLTVVYDPYSGVDRETTIQSHPVTPAPEATRKPITGASKASGAERSQGAHPESKKLPTRPLDEQPAQPAQPSARPVQSKPTQKPTQPAQATQPPASQPAQAGLAQVSASEAQSQPNQAPQPAPSQSIPQAPSQEPARAASCMPPAEILATYPVDFSTDVYLASERIGDLCELLPYGTDVFALLAEDYTRARTLELISGSRARATFPLRMEHLDSTEPIRVTLKKRSGSGLQWELASIE